MLGPNFNICLFGCNVNSICFLIKNSHGPNLIKIVRIETVHRVNVSFIQHPWFNNH